MHLNRKEMCIGFAAKKVKCIRKLQVPEKIGKLLLKGLAPQVCQEYRLYEEKNQQLWKLTD